MLVFILNSVLRKLNEQQISIIIYNNICICTYKERQLRDIFPAKVYKMKVINNITIITMIIIITIIKRK